MARGLAGKVAIVTGASSGFGRAIALAMARHGARIVVGDIREEAPAGNFDESPGQSTVELVAAGGGDALFVPCDVSRQDDVVRLVGRAVERFGGLDILVNNAGVWRGNARMHELPEEALEACWSVLVKGSWFCAQEAIKAFLAQGRGGNIINIVSTAGLRGHSRQAAYNVAKGAQANLTRCLALEYAADGIRVNGICPSVVKTAMSRKGYESPEFNEAVLSRVVPLGRWGEVKDVADLAVFLASDESSFVHGALIPLDGGETLGAARSA